MADFIDPVLAITLTIIFTLVYLRMRAVQRRNGS